MKKMKIEKQLIFADQVQQVNSLKVSEHLNYRHEDDGIRAMGPLYIEGEYTGKDGTEKFREALEMDVLAPNHKLNGEPFSLIIEDYQAKANDDTIQVTITLGIQGISDEKADQKPLTEPKATNAITKENPTPVMTAQPKMEAVNEAIDSVQTETDAAKQAEAPSENTVVDDFNDLFSDAESTYTSYRIIVAKPNDTYATIANRCEVDEQQLRDTNKNKEITAKTPVILPFQ